MSCATKCDMIDAVKIRVLLYLSLVVLEMAPSLKAQEIDGSDLRNQVRDREARVNKLSVEDQLKLRAAEVKAAQDPAVQEAMKKRNEAIREFRAAIRAAMIKADPSVAPILDKVAIPDNTP